jgi:hypothetical protein
MTQQRKVDDSELEKVTGGASGSDQDSDQTFSQAESPFENADDDTDVSFGDDMLIIDRNT